MERFIIRYFDSKTFKETQTSYDTRDKAEAAAEIIFNHLKAAGTEVKIHDQMTQQVGQYMPGEEKDRSK